MREASPAAAEDELRRLLQLGGRSDETSVSILTAKDNSLVPIVKGGCAWGWSNAPQGRPRAPERGRDAGEAGTRGLGPRHTVATGASPGCRRYSVAAEPISKRRFACAKVSQQQLRLICMNGRVERGKTLLVTGFSSLGNLCHAVPQCRALA